MIPETELGLRKQIVDFGHLMYQKGWIAGNDGNISVRLDSDRLLVTPTQVCKGLLCESDLVICNLNGEKIEGRRERTSEILVHLAVYEMRPEVKAVVHAHPPAATAFALAGRALDAALLPEVIVNLGCVPLTSYGQPGTRDLSDQLSPYISSHNALLMANHGVVCYAHDLASAFFRLETVEHSAKIIFMAELLGGAKALPRKEVNKLLHTPSAYGSRPNGTAIDGLKAAEDLRRASNGAVYSRGELFDIIDEVLRRRIEFSQTA